jgi:hypothetical protein
MSAPILLTELVCSGVGDHLHVIPTEHPWIVGDRVALVGVNST